MSTKGQPRENYFRYFACLLVLVACSGTGKSVDGAKTDANGSELNETLVCEPIGLGLSHPYHQQFTALLENAVTSGFPGLTAAVFTPESGLWVDSAGKANIEKNIIMQPCHVLFSGSVAKTYTVTAAMWLYEQGLLDLDSGIAPFLPNEVANKLPNGQTATIRQLMNHTAGMPDHDDEESLEEYLLSHEGTLPSAEEQLATLYDNPTLFEPGSEARYSSAHTVALAMVIDKIAGEHHGTTISREIINKLGLKETFYKNEPGLPKPANLVEGYVNDGSSIDNYTTAAVNYANSSHDTGVMATAHDYYLFLRGLVEGDVLDFSKVDLMKTTAPVYSDDNITFGYGLGLITTLTGDGQLVKMGHSGGTLGGMSHVYYYPTVDSYIVLLTNILPVDDRAMLEYWGSGWLGVSDKETIISEFERLIDI